MDTSEHKIFLHPIMLSSFLLAERTRLALWLPVGLAAGILLYFLPFHEPPLWPALIGITLALCSLASPGCYHPVIRVLVCGCLTISLGYAAMWSQTHRQTPMPELPRRTVIANGSVHTIETLPQNPTDHIARRRITLADTVFDMPQTEGMKPLKRLLTIRLQETDVTELSPGDQIHLPVLVQAPLFPSLPGGQDRQRDAWFNNIAGSGRASGAVSVDHHTPSSIFRIERLRNYIANQFMAALPQDEGAIAATLFAGKTAAITPEDRSAFSASGLSHLLAVAGLHLGMIMGLTMAVTRLLLAMWTYAALRWPCREISALTALCVGGGYVLLTGMHLPALRSLTMAAFAMLALIVGRRVISMRGLALAAAILLLTGPYDLLGASFQMSFMAVMALIAGYEVLRRPLSRIRGEGEWYRQLASHACTLAMTSILAGLATLPVSLVHFGQIQPFFVLANMVAVPLTTFWIMPAGLLSLILMPLHLAIWPITIMGYGIGLVLSLAREVASWPYASIPVTPPPVWGQILFFLGMCWLCLWHQSWRLLGIVPLFAGLLSPCFVNQPNILMSPDGDVIAIRTRSALLTYGKGRNSWVEEADWSQAMALPALSLTQHSDLEKSLSCDPQDHPELCMLTINNRKILIGLRLPAHRHPPSSFDLCANAALAILTFPANQHCPGSEDMIDRFTVWREGSIAIWLDSHEIKQISGRAWSGNRPWVLRPGKHGTPLLRMANSE